MGTYANWSSGAWGLGLDGPGPGSWGGLRLDRQLLLVQLPPPLLRRLRTSPLPRHPAGDNSNKTLTLIKSNLTLT